MPFDIAMECDVRDLADDEIDEARRIMGAEKLVIRLRDGVPPHGWLLNAKGDILHIDTASSLKTLAKLAPFNRRIDELNAEDHRRNARKT